MTAQELIEAAMRSLGIVAAGQSPTSDELDDGLEALYFMLRFWATKSLLVPFITIESFTLTGAASYTIGSGGDFDTVRPARIVGAYTMGSVKTPIKIFGPEKFRELTNLSGTTAYLFYNPTHPLGTIYLHPQSSDTLYLESLKELTEPATLATDTGFPPEYDEAIKWNLAKRLAPEFGRVLTQEQKELAQETFDGIIAYNAAQLAMEPVKTEILYMAGSWDIREG